MWTSFTRLFLPLSQVYGLFMERKTSQRYSVGTRAEPPKLPPISTLSPVALLLGAVYQVQDVGFLAVACQARQKEDNGAALWVRVTHTPTFISPIQQQLPAVCSLQHLTEGRRKI